MTTSVDTSYGSWPATTPPFITKYGVVTNPSTSFSTGVVLDPYGAPPSLFINNEQGVWYDPSDFSTMFQDSAGRTPVTAVEQPVGLILDKSKGLVLGPELVVNGACTGLTGWTSSGGNLTNPGGITIKADTGAGGTEASAVNEFTVVAGKSYKITLDLIAANNSGAVILGGVRVTLPGPSTNSGFKSVIITAASTTVSGVEFTSNTPTAGYYIEVDNISVRELPGNHAKQATSTKRPVLKQDANGKYYLLFDGVDDALATSSIDFTATDKMTVFAGVRKLSDAARGVLVELTTGTANRFGIDAPGAVLNNYLLISSGSLAVAVSAAVAAPNTDVLTGICDISGDRLIFRRNGTQVESSVADQGTGNYANAALYIGSRAGTSLPFNGHLYSLIVRGAQSTDAQIVSAETYVNSKTSAY